MIGYGGNIRFLRLLLIKELLTGFGVPQKSFHQRLRHVHFPLKSKELHLSVVNEVKAKSQSNSLSQIEHLLNKNEIDLIRRARNKTKKYPKSSNPTIYSRATGFETLIGWLFLKDPQRLSILFEYLEIKM